MRREDVFMDILGGLDESLVAEAMPAFPEGEPGTLSAVPEADSAAPTKKALRMYIIARALGAAAAIALIAGAVLLIWQNWDKIAARAPDIPDTAGYAEGLPDISEACGKLIKFSSADVRLTKLYYDGEMLSAVFTILDTGAIPEGGNYEIPYPVLWINVEGADNISPSCVTEPVMEADSFDYITTSSARLSLEPGRTYTVNVEFNRYGVRESDPQKYSFTCPDISASDEKNDSYIRGDGPANAEELAEKLLKGMRWGLSSEAVQHTASEYWGRTAPRIVDTENDYDVIVYDDMELYGEKAAVKAELSLIVTDGTGLSSLDYQFRFDVSNEGAMKADELYEYIRAEFTRVLGEPDQPGMDQWDADGGDLSFNVYKADNWNVEVKLYDTSA